MKSRTHLVFFLSLMLATVSACATSKEAGTSEANIAWFTAELQNDGIFASHDGTADLTIPSDYSGRFVLNGHERVNVYQFSSSSLASQIAQKLVTDNPRLTVYQYEELVVSRRDVGDVAITQSLMRFMGRRV